MASQQGWYIPFPSASAARVMRVRTLLHRPRRLQRDSLQIGSALSSWTTISPFSHVLDRFFFSPLEMIARNI